MISNFPSQLDTNTRLIDLSYNNLKLISAYNQSLHFSFLVKLILANNRITSITSGSFQYMQNLLVLDLSFNDIPTIPKDTFLGLKSLIFLNLYGNFHLQSIESYSFMGLQMLPHLQLKSMKLQSLPEYGFMGLDSIVTIDLTDNDIFSVAHQAFSGLGSLQQLYISGNNLKYISGEAFKDLTNLRYLSSDHFKLCCMALQVPREYCFPPQDPISSCRDLMQNGVLRTFIWILGFMAFLGNIFVIIWRTKFPTSGVADIIITNLVISDFIMGVYLLIIGTVDLYYQGVFIQYSDIWRESWLCKLSGFLATFSSEASVMFLCILTIDRFTNIIFPFSDVKFTKSSIKLASMTAWILAFVVSVAPFIPIDYFGGNYYGRSGVCMALPITNETPQGGCILIIYNYTPVNNIA